MVPEEKLLLKHIADSNTKAFEQLFNSYYQILCVYCKHYFTDNQICENIVQDVFVRIWEKRTELEITTSLKVYLFSAVKNRCLNQLEHQRVRQDYFEKNNKLRQTDYSRSSDFYYEVGLAEKIKDAIDSLPPRRREIFRLNREKGLKYKEIAEKLNISVKTVEVQMGQALKDLREKLKDYNSDLHLFFWIRRASDYN
ncbi:RNA polymerase sigma-70 factor [Puteibacter caeruleilacunae]|nr:RNA polymerase sigma-70 factor [Puteibacter caeruleilacunae]